MGDALRAIHAVPNTRMFILSDANSIFIREALSAHELGHCFAAADAVYTNAAHVDADSDRVRVRRFHDAAAEPHNCHHCPLNLCKGAVLDAIRARAEHVNARFVYVGDGRNDWCPTSRLRAGDWVFARSAYALGDLWRAHVCASGGDEALAQLPDGRVVHRAPRLHNASVVDSAVASGPSVLWWQSGEHVRDAFTELLAEMHPRTRGDS